MTPIEAFFAGVLVVAVTLCLCLVLGMVFGKEQERDKVGFRVCKDGSVEAYNKRTGETINLKI